MMLETHRDARQYLMDYMRRDLVGPQSERELLTDLPTTQYLAGILYPGGAKPLAEEDDESDSVSETADDQDTGTAQINASLPSAMGMSFIVAGNTAPFRLRASAAHYIQETAQVTTTDTALAVDGPTTPDTSVMESESGVEETHRSAQLTTRWRRVPDTLGNCVACAEPSTVKKISDGLVLQVIIRPFGADRLVTVTLINQHANDISGSVSPDRCFFQPHLAVMSEPEGQPIFVAREPVHLSRGDEDVDTNRLLYRHALEYAVGHGCAVNWRPEGGEPPTVITSQVIPEFEVANVVAERKYTGPALNMTWLASAKGTDLEQELSALLDGYSDWIQDIRVEAMTLGSRYRATAEKHVERCVEAEERMRTGVRLLVVDSMARRAFQMACGAMSDQRRQILIIKQKIRAGDPFEANWRPFQLAFILMCLPSMTDSQDAFRDTVDLLWFPTGGGKTEAYLGLAAYAILLRRLRATAAGAPDVGAGTTVLMRYTLRLLTIQQFQRAATLICALELARRKDESAFGGAPVTIGLWVGSDTTPNSMKAAQEAVRFLHAGQKVKTGNPRQLEICPWCGATLSDTCYSVPAPGDRLMIRCPAADCPFRAGPGLPVRVVDEVIYREPPSLLIGVVDKFAQMPWHPMVGRLFGRETQARPPELIIQDEMHLISGPLGTLVGLYESAIDLLTEEHGRGPKIIASTATIRRASDQTRGLFNRRVHQFPPPGLDARDSFFARAQRLDREPGRMYLGVQAAGRSGKTVQLRIMAALLQAVHTMDAPAKIKDPYYTLVGYYNSIRELGGAVRLVEDDVAERIQHLARRETRDPRKIEPAVELTSRQDSSAIPGLLEDMARTIDDGAIDVLLATNMISVGVDVDRLSLMVVVGQPKTTAEYIQATSRVGRATPGLVVTMYLASRPRDRSHYERFTAYHSAIYSQVEATSVTPFSARARDRGLHAVLIALVRHMASGMSGDYAPHRLLENSVETETQRLVERILQRVEEVDEPETEDTRRELQEILRHWRELVDRYGSQLRYGQKPGVRMPSDPFIMYSADRYDRAAIAASDGEEEPLSFATLNSLREVEPTCSLYLLKGMAHGAR